MSIALVLFILAAAAAVGAAAMVATNTVWSGRLTNVAIALVAIGLAFALA